MNLGGYERFKFAIADILRSGLAHARETGSDLDEQFQALFARLAEDRFNLVVVGRFSRGKTSLMNAMLAMDRLPTGIIPLTSVITSVAYGSVEKVVLKYRQRILTKEIPVEALKEHITQKGNPGNIQDIAAAEVRLPAEILRRGFFFIDTPGIGSAIVENTLTTETFLPEADAFILVTSYESPLSEEEVRLLKVASSTGRKVFVVVNKHDMVSAADRNDAFAFVQQQVVALPSANAAEIFSVSSTNGLAAKRSCDEARLAASGIPQLEEALVAFLLKDKRQRILIGTCARARDLLTQLPCSDLTKSLLARIDELAKQISDIGALVKIRERVWPGEASPNANLHRLHSCEICSSVADEVWNFLARYQYDLTVSNDEQRLFAESSGFCSFHAWQYQSVASAYSVCNGYVALLDRLAAELRSAASTTDRREHLLGKIEELLPRQAQCPLCVAQRNAEVSAIGAVAARLDENLEAELASLSVICLPHLTMLVAAVREDKAASELVARQGAVLERISEDMRRHALQYNALRRDLSSQEDSSAGDRAILAAAGRRNLKLCRREPAHRSRHAPYIEAVGKVADR